MQAPISRRTRVKEVNERRNATEARCTDLVPALGIAWKLVPCAMRLRSWLAVHNGRPRREPEGFFSS